MIRAPEGRQVVVTDPHKLLAGYEQGHLTAHELVTRLIEAAAEQPPEELVPPLPADILLALRQRAAEAPTEGGVYIWGGNLMPGVDPQEFMADKKRIWGEGVRRWRGYFGITGKSVAPPGLV
jgi:hypothetical protein